MTIIILSIEKNLNIKNSACMALSSLLVDMAREEIISIEQKGCLLEIILNTMFARNVALALKITLQSALQELYSVDKGNPLFRSRKMHKKKYQFCIVTQLLYKKISSFRIRDRKMSYIYL